MRLCGFISRFQLLSPGTGQVTHALLTRPPLSCILSIRRSQKYNSVRLACVRHAASVHPEPGSNSQFIIIRSGQIHCWLCPLIYFFTHMCPAKDTYKLFFVLNYSHSLSTVSGIFQGCITVYFSRCIALISCISRSSASWRLLSRNVLYFITCGSLCQELFYFIFARLLKKCDLRSG